MFSEGNCLVFALKLLKLGISPLAGVFDENNKYFFM